MNNHEQALKALKKAKGCFDAAEAEGLSNILAFGSENFFRLKDLVERRLMFAIDAIEQAIASLQPTEQAGTSKGDLYGICMMVAEAAYKEGCERDRAVAADKLRRQWDAASNSVPELIARLRKAEAASNTCKVDYLRANFTPFYLLANVRAIVATQWQRKANWVLASRLFAVGSTTARAICKEAGIDPDGTEVRMVAAPSDSGREG